MTPFTENTPVFFLLERHYSLLRVTDKNIWNGRFVPVMLEMLHSEGLAPEPSRLVGAAHVYIFELREAKESSRSSCREDLPTVALTDVYLRWWLSLPDDACFERRKQTRTQNYQKCIFMEGFTLI